MTAKQQREISQRVQTTLGAEVICTRCGATWETYADKCCADLDERCPGFNRIEEVRQPIVREVYGFPSLPADGDALGGKGE